MSDKTGAVMVVGGGISGVQTALDLAESGFQVYLIEKTPSIGGVMSQLDKTFPTNDCSMCILSPKLVEAARHPLINLMTMSEVTEVSGEAPNFQVKVRHNPRYVSMEKCVGCGLCAEKCPVKVPNEYDANLINRKAIYIPYAQAVPMKYSIDASKCLKITKGRCGLCEKNCPAGAISYEDKAVEETLDIGAIVLAPGFSAFDARLKKEYGYGEYANVVTSIEFERFLSATGPHGGHVVRPSDQKAPKKVAFLQCVGSRDEKVGNTYCSSVCCMYAMKQAIIAGEHTAGLEPVIFFMDIRAVGKEFEDYRARAEKEYGIKMHRASRVANILEDPETKNLTLRYSDSSGNVAEEEFDLVVLSLGLEPPKDAQNIGKIFGVNLNKFGFASTNVYSPLTSSRPGVFVTGAFAAPKDIPTSVAEASGAAAKAGAFIANRRGHLEDVKKAEIDVEGQEPRIGVFVCDCGINIKGTVNVPSVVDYAKTLPNVIFAEENKYTCSADSQERIKDLIKKEKLNRVVIASCTPRTHEPLFMSTLKEAGLNPYLFEMANIRDQCSWIHMGEPEKATKKSKDLVRMAVAKSRLLEPLYESNLPVTHSALVVGGGISGMTAALDIAAQGFHVDLIERAGELGGNAMKIYHEEDGRKVREFAKELITRVRNNKNITVHLTTEVQDVGGFVGNFKVKTTAGEIETGSIVVAVGAEEYKPKEFLYGQDKRVVTQLELEDQMQKGPVAAKKIAMIQCVGSRNTEAPFCSRVCCANAIKNAISLKKSNPKSDVYVFHKDIRTYGFREELYKEAGQLGIKFVRVPEDKPPMVTKEGDSLKLVATDTILGDDIMIKPDLLVLSAGIRPHHSNEDLAKMLKVPLSKDKYFLEAHMKLRPVDFATNGIYLAGLAHWPKFTDEAIAQASGAAARAMTIISKPQLRSEGIIAAVNEDLCDGCAICEPVCEYKAITIVADPKNPEKKKAIVNEGLCKGCGCCVAACPSGSMEQRGFKTTQIIAAIDAALEEESE